MKAGCEDIVTDGHVNIDYETVLDIHNISAEDRLIFSIMQKNPKRVKYLIEQGADVNYILKDVGWSPLMCASVTGVAQTVKTLLQNGADPNHYSGQFTPLICLCVADTYDDLQLIEWFNLLVEAGANVNAKGYRSMTPIMFSAVAGHSHLTSCLLTHGADIDAVANNGWSAIFYAVNFKNAECVRVLTRTGSNMALRDKNGSTVGDLSSSNDDISRILFPPFNKYQFCQNLQELDNKKLLNIPMPETVYKGFYKEVIRTLRTIGLKYLIPFFIEKKIGYGQFLLFNDEEWKKVGIKYSYDRQKLIWNARHLLKHCWARGGLFGGSTDLEQFWAAQLMAQKKNSQSS